MGTALDVLSLGAASGLSMPGLLPVNASTGAIRIDEEASVRQAAAIGDIDYVFFRRFSDGRSSQVAAFVIDNSDERLDEKRLARIHQKLWLNGSSPLLYIGWETRVDVLSCARGPDFWRNNDYSYEPADTIATASQISAALKKKILRFSGLRLSDGTFWEDPENFNLAKSDKGAHRRLINAVVDADREINGAQNPLLRRLLLLIVLIKYLEDRGVFPDGWFGQFHKGANSFFDVLQQGTADDVRELLSKLERKFNGDVFELPEDTKEKLNTKDLRRFAELVEARTVHEQRYLWEQFSFRYIPVEVLSHLYQRFAQSGKGAVFTPAFVANLMLDYSLPYDRLKGTETILDPTCGSGVFLVAAFRRLIQFWRRNNGWSSPDVQTLKTILKQCIFGVELQQEAMHLTAFSLALAVCDALQPNVIWKDLRFDKLAGANLLDGDFFERLAKLREMSGKDGFAVIVGNPPFLSKFSESAEQANSFINENHPTPIPDKQMAYLIAEQAMSLLQPGGHMCLLQPAGFLYNEKARPFQRGFIANNQLEAVLDFTSVRGLYDGADPKTIALVAKRKKPLPSHRIRHYTFRRTFSVQEKIGFELDPYDRHTVDQSAVLEQDSVWRINLLGGGRLHHLIARLHKMPKLVDFISEMGWNAGEGYIAGDTCKRGPAPWLTGKPLLPTEALTERGLDFAKITKVKDTLFAASRTEERYKAPLVLIKEHETLPCIFWDQGFLAYKDQIVGIRGDISQTENLRMFCKQFNKNRNALRAFCLLLGTKALIGKATAIVKRDIEVLPWPKATASWDLSQWEAILCEDVVNLIAEFIRLGQDSVLLKKQVSGSDLAAYTEVFISMLGSVYTNLKAGKFVLLDGLACQLFYFGKAPDISWPEDWKIPLSVLVYVQHGEELRTIRVVRHYDRNVILIVKQSEEHTSELQSRQYLV